MTVWSLAETHFTSELFDTDEELRQYDRHKVRSQVGVVVAAIPAEDLDQMDEISVSILDWRSRSSARVVVSTFAAETSAALEGYGMAAFMRAMLCEAMYGHSGASVTDYGEEQMPVILFTDCRSLYDHVKSEGNVPDDKHTAIYVAALKTSVSAGVGRNECKAQMRWVASRWMLADGLTKGGLADQMRYYMSTATTRIHEESAQALLRRRKRGKVKSRKKRRKRDACYGLRGTRVGEAQHPGPNSLHHPYHRHCHSMMCP